MRINLPRALDLISPELERFKTGRLLHVDGLVLLVAKGSHRGGKNIHLSLLETERTFIYDALVQVITWASSGLGYAPHDYSAVEN